MQLEGRVGVQLLDILPLSSFVGFEAQRLARPKVIWQNGDPRCKIELDSYAFCIPLGDDPPCAYSNEKRQFYAERYGGAGVVRNGGGARCGIQGTVQIKGIGRNPLAGSEAEFWHSYGGESVAGGIRDAIWGEICNEALPYGAARIFGIIDTGTTVPLFSATEGPISRTCRGLTIRESLLRPSHYIRSLYFWKGDEQSAGMVSDAVRTRMAVQTIAVPLQKMTGMSSPLLSASLINAGLQEMFRRFAVQAAAAQAKKIVHGAITASNISFDGKWLDFGTASTVADFGRIMVTKGPDALSHEPTAAIANDLVYYLRKYSCQPARNIIDAPALMNAYRAHFQRRSEIEFFKLTGMPETARVLLPHLAHTLSACIAEILSHAPGEPFHIYHRREVDGPVMPFKMGGYHLNTILVCAVFSESAAGLDQALREHLDNQVLREKFSESYWAIRNAYLAAKRGRDRAAKEVFICLNGLRLNSALPELYRPTLDAAIDDMVLNMVEPDTFIEHYLQIGRTYLCDVCAFGIDLSAWSQGRLLLSDEDGFLFNNVSIPLLQGLAHISDTVLAAPHRKHLEKICSAQ